MLRAANLLHPFPAYDTVAAIEFYQSAAGCMDDLETTDPSALPAR
jgi:hypothetical protein